MSPFSLSFLSRDRDLFDRSLPEREDFEPVRRFSLLSPLVYREQSMSTNYFIVIIIKNNLDIFVTKEEDKRHEQLLQIKTILQATLYRGIPFSFPVSVPFRTFPSVTPVSISVS